MNTVYGNSHFPATVPIVLPRPKSADLVADIHKQLSRSKDFDEQSRLLALAVNVLKRRQLDRRPRARRRGRAGR